MSHNVEEALAKYFIKSFQQMILYDELAIYIRFLKIYLMLTHFHRLKYEIEDINDVSGRWQRLLCQSVTQKVDDDVLQKRWRRIAFFYFELCDGMECATRQKELINLRFQR